MTRNVNAANVMEFALYFFFPFFGLVAHTGSPSVLRNIRQRPWWADSFSAVHSGQISG